MNILAEIDTNSKMSLIGNNKKLTLIRLRGLFSSIIGSTNELLEEDEIDNIEESIRKIHLNAIESYSLLDNFVHSTKINKKDYIVETNSVDLGMIVKKVISFYRQKIINKKLEIILSIDENSNISFQENLVNLIVRNIILNAIVSSHEGGRVRVSTKRYANSLDIVVEDDGKGVSQKDIAWILKDSVVNFNNKSFNENPKRLGLKICKVYVEKINGELMIGSQSGKESRVEVKFPVA